MNSEKYDYEKNVADVAIRCYVLGQVFGKVFDEAVEKIRDSRKDEDRKEAEV